MSASALDRIPTAAWVVGGVALLGLVFLKRNPNAFNPASPDNVFNRGFTGLYQALTGSKQAPGADLYDSLHADELAALSKPVTQGEVNYYRANQTTVTNDRELADTNIVWAWITGIGDEVEAARVRVNGYIEAGGGVFRGHGATGSW